MIGAAGLAYEHYRFAGHDEWLMRIGPPDAPPILFVPPLLEEMNRTRALMAGVMRRLAAAGFGCWLMDLPGTGESERDLEGCRWEDWTGAVSGAAESIAAKADRHPLVVALRGGCLVDHAASPACAWRLAPVAGASLARDLERAALVGGGAKAGYPIPDALLAGLAAAMPQPLSRQRTVRLAGDAADADAKLPGPALWRRSEPDTSSELTDTISQDIIEWAGQCGAC